MRLVYILTLTSLFSFSCTKEIIQHKLSVEVSPINGGSVTPPSNSYEKGQSLQMLATATGEYIFKEWKGDLTGTSNPTTLVIDKDKQVTGSFEKRQYPLNLTIEGSGTVKEEIIAVATQSQYPSGTTVRLTPLPLEGWTFSDWSGDLLSQLNPLDIIVNKPIALKATFSKLTLKKLEVENSIDTLVISRKHKFKIKAIYSNNSSVDVSNQITITLDTNLINQQADRTLIGAKSGTANISISYLDLSIQQKLFVSNYEIINVIPQLSSEGNDCKITVPVLSISYLPTKNGIDLDMSRAPDEYDFLWFSTLEQSKNKIIDDMIIYKNVVEEGTRFRDYGRNKEPKYVCLNVLKNIIVYEMDFIVSNNGQKVDYNKLFKKLGVRSFIEAQNVKEIWFNHYPLYNTPVLSKFPEIYKNSIFWGLDESNMSSPTTGDISNSDRSNDLPIYNNTYVVYAMNKSSYASVSNNLHCRAHQIEAELNYIETKKLFPSASEIANTLFWGKFVGMKSNASNNGWEFTLGKCGRTHNPPNTLTEYDYNNPTSYLSTISDWKPDGTGQLKLVNNSTWTKLSYAHLNFSNNYLLGKQRITYDWDVNGEFKWLLYWFQSIPGLNNKIEYDNKGTKTILSNWWDLLFNWDLSFKNNKTLWIE